MSSQVEAAFVFYWTMTSSLISTESFSFNSIVTAQNLTFFLLYVKISHSMWGCKTGKHTRLELFLCQNKIQFKFCLFNNINIVYLHICW